MEHRPMCDRERCIISPAVNQGSFVSLCFVMFALWVGFNFCISCTVLSVSSVKLIGCEDCHQNDLDAMDHSDGVLKSELLQLLERINIHSYLKSLIILNSEAYIAMHFFTSREIGWGECRQNYLRLSSGTLNLIQLSWVLFAKLATEYA